MRRHASRVPATRSLPGWPAACGPWDANCIAVARFNHRRDSASPDTCRRNSPRRADRTSTTFRGRALTLGFETSCEPPILYALSRGWTNEAGNRAGPVVGLPHPSSAPTAPLRVRRLRGGRGGPTRRHPLDRPPDSRHRAGGTPEVGAPFTALFLDDSLPAGGQPIAHFEILRQTERLQLPDVGLEIKRLLADVPSQVGGALAWPLVNQLQSAACPGAGATSCIKPS